MQNALTRMSKSEKKQVAELCMIAANMEQLLLQ